LRHTVRVPGDSGSIAGLLVIVLCVGGCKPGGSDSGLPRSASDPSKPPDAPTVGLISPAQRADALSRAQVWQPPSVPIADARLSTNPGGPGGFAETETVSCRLVVKPMSGTTPKFDCARDGDTFRVKYGRGNPELYSEVATTRLLSALGFGADRMFVVRKVECGGCTPFPFQSLRCLATTGLEHACFPRGLDAARSTPFDDAVIERRVDGRRLESTLDQGWAWFELDRVDPQKGGAPRAHVDALKLLAVFLAHWDNKAENQRLICLPGGDRPDGSCARPLAMLQDVGASFGPIKLDLPNWRALPIWADASTCRVSMEDLPWGGGTFPAQQISEEGRQFLLKLLRQLSFDQVGALFAAAGVERAEAIAAETRRPQAWAAAFLDKVDQIAKGGPCPSIR
jgi:hypothetical protein